MCVYVLFPSLTSLTYIALQSLGVFDLSLTSSTYIALQPLGVFDLSLTSSTYIALQPLGVFDLSLTIFDIDSITFKQYHIKKGMIKNVSVSSFPIFDFVFDLSLTSSTYVALQPLGVFDLSLTSLT